MTTDSPAALVRRRPWLAGLLNLLLAPIGHVYAGALLRGVVLCLAALAVMTGALVQLARPHGGGSQILPLVMFPIVLGTLVADAWWVASRKAARWSPARRRWWVYLAVGVVSLISVEVGGQAIETYVLRAYRIRSLSMWPALHVGDHVLVDNLTYRRREPARYEVVVVEPPGGGGRRYISRVIGLPGETVEIRTRRVYVNGTPLDEGYVYFAAGPSETVVGRDDLAPVMVPEGEYFVLGDNRDRSHDSRRNGTVPESAILGVVRSIYWSRDGDSGLRWDRMGKPVR